MLWGMHEDPFEFGKAFAAIVEKHRKQAQLSRAALAERSGLHQTYIGLMEKGLRSPNLGTAKALAKGLNMPLSQLVKEAENNFPSTR